jgi:hypothetical protein
MQDYHQLEIWQRAMAYAVHIYEFSSTLPDNERYNLTAQLRRAVTSVRLNIAGIRVYNRRRIRSVPELLVSIAEGGRDVSGTDPAPPSVIAGTIGRLSDRRGRTNLSDDLQLHAAAVASKLITQSS